MSDLRRVQWKLFWRPASAHADGPTWTAVHYCERGAAKTLCGRRIGPDYETDYDDKTGGRECQKCARAARQ
jgi:hypothetical protein